jgi:uncharacterized repeat protein (TIGR01451 family)
LKFLAHIRLFVLLAVVFLGGQQAQAQDFALSITTSTNLVVGTNTLTYGMTLTNQSGFVFQDVLITNQFSDSVSVINATNSQGTNGIVSSFFVFNLGRMINGQIAQTSLTIQPVDPGLLTNTITLAAAGRTNQFVTNIVTLAAAAVFADLGITIIPPIQAIITNDFVTYDLLVTNTGSSSITGVIVTNVIPTNVLVRAVSQAFTVVSNTYVLSLGTLNANSSVDLRFDITPTNVGTLHLFAVVTADGLVNTSPTNNTFATNVPVIAYLPGTIMAATNSGQILNPQNGLTEQSVLLSNTGTNDVPAVRLVWTGLPTTKRLFNAVGTNNANPFVYYSAPLASGSQATLLLQYAPRGLVTNIQLHAYAVPLPNWTPPAGFQTRTNITISRIVALPNGNPLIEFPATNGSAYTIIYSSDMNFSNAMIAPPGIVAPANRVQWIDYGPPTTVSPPSSVPMRFYRVLPSP